MNLGLSGRLTKATLHSPLTPLMLLAAIAVGLMAVLSIPREEEPQISVPMVDIMVAAPGLSASDATELAAKPLEAIVRSIDGVEHVYTQVQDDQVMVTARFMVGSDPDDAAVRVHEKVRANYGSIPVGVSEPTTIGPGFSTKRSNAAAASTAWSTWQIETVWPSGPRPGISSNARSGPVAMTR